MTVLGDRIGLSCAISTPFGRDTLIDVRRLTRHAANLLSRGCDSVTLFGTTGEGPSISIRARHSALGAIVASGLDPARQLIVGVSANSVSDAVDQARAGYDAGARALLMAPPFYFSSQGDEGLFVFFSQVFNELGGRLRDVILYHIPAMTRNGISVELTRRLATAFPGVIIGVKDSHGDWAATERRLKELQGLQILVGDERQLAAAVRLGGSGSICGMANLVPELIRPLAIDGIEDSRVNRLVDMVVRYPVMSAIKALIAEELADPDWRRMAPPLEALPREDSFRLHRELTAIRGSAAD